MARSSDSFIEYMNKAHPDTEEHLLECEECFEIHDIQKRLANLEQRGKNG